MVAHTLTYLPNVGAFGPQIVVHASMCLSNVGACGPSMPQPPSLTSIWYVADISSCTYFLKGGVPYGAFNRIEPAKSQGNIFITTPVKLKKIAIPCLISFSGSSDLTSFKDDSTIWFIAISAIVIKF